MSKILKNFWKPAADTYVLQPAEDLVVEPPPPPSEEPPEGTADEQVQVQDTEQEQESESVYEESPQEKELRYARLQAEAIIRDARKEAEAYQEEARKAVEQELEQLRDQARQDGYNSGYAQGLDDAMKEGRRQIDAMSKEQIQSVERFLEAAARERDRIYDDCREDMKDLALAIAEKVIRVSLKNSSDILLRMVDAATDTHKRCEWARIYVADSDLEGKAFTVPELTEQLGHVAERIRVIPMADDESGTCIVELPDVILDASVSTQLGNIKELLSDIGTD